MKKVLVAGAALMLAGGVYASAASAAAVEPGVKITGDARVRAFYQSEEYFNNFGNTTPAPGTSDWDSQTNMDSRVRLNIAGTAAGGAYAKARIRLMEGRMGDMDTDTGYVNSLNQDNIWADQAYMGIPFAEMFTLELGKYRSTYGPLPTTYNFFYDDVNLSGGRGIVKVGNIDINPFIEWMDEANNPDFNLAGTADQRQDNDEMRYGAHIKGKINKDWTLGGILGFQTDDRQENLAGQYNNANSVTANDGFFASIYTIGKYDNFGLVGEFGVTDSDINGFNTWYDDNNITTTSLYGQNVRDIIGSADTGYGGYINPTYTIDKLTIGINAGFTADGFLPDRAYGFVMLGGTDNSVITRQQIGVGGDWLWGGLVAQYAFSESLKLTGNLVYADIDSWTQAGDGPGFTGGNNLLMLDSALEISAVLQYTISKGMDVYFSMGYLEPDSEYVNVTRVNPSIQDDGAFGALTRFELKF